ncbi:hypothetical protein J6590_101328 [Homalodisca vitripennis]|nr:hypothetical protein J6590_101328 [Homalodisca vitripennis]
MASARTIAKAVKLWRIKSYDKRHKRTLVKTACRIVGSRYGVRNINALTTVGLKSVQVATVAGGRCLSNTAFLIGPQKFGDDVVQVRGRCCASPLTVPTDHCYVRLRSLKWPKPS